MALKNIKIFRELIQNCNKLLGNPEKLAFSTKVPAYSVYKDDPKEIPVFSMKGNEICDKTLPTSLRKLMDQRDMRIGTPIEQYEQLGDLFPVTKKFQGKTINSVRHFSSSYTPKKELEAKSEQYGKDCEKKKKRSCKIKQEKRKCQFETDCPKFALKDCPEAIVPPDCHHQYREVDCSKVPAPYPSYSETCVEHMPEDPSECAQCPWRRCRDAHSIRPQKVKRKYHTMIARTQSGAPSPTYLGLIPESINCDASKKPCKEPPGKCEEQKKMYEEARKRRQAKQKKKKCTEWSNSLGVLMRKPVEIQNLNPYTLLPLENGQVPTSTNSVVLCIKDKGGKEKFPDCPPKFYPELDDRSMDVLCIKDGVPELPKFPNCPTKINPVPDDRSMDVTMQAAKCNKDKKKKNKKPKGDEGFPPPCPEEQGESLDCPRKPLLPKKYRKRPLRDVYYRRHEEPYTDSGNKS